MSDEPVYGGVKNTDNTNRLGDPDQPGAAHSSQANLYCNRQKQHRNDREQQIAK